MSLSRVPPEPAHADLTIRAMLMGARNRSPNDLAAVDGDLRLDYDELAAKIDTYAKALLALGVRRGDRVAMLTPPSIDYWIALHGATSIGAIWVGVNPRYQQRDFEHLLGDSAPAALLAVSPFEDRDYCVELRPLLPEGCPIVCHGTPSAGAVDLSDFLASAGRVSDAELAVARAAVEPEDAAVIVYTSGTTGRPKGAMLSHRAIVTSARANAAWMGADDLAR